MVQDRLQTGDGRHPTASQGEATSMNRPLKRRPETEKRSEGKGDEEAIRRVDPDGVVDLVPAFEKPSPARRCIQPANTPAAGPCGLMQLYILLDRLGKFTAVRRMKRLILN